MTTLEPLQPSGLLPMELPLISFAEAFPAKTSARLAEGLDWPASGQACGQKSPAWFANYDRATSSWKTCQLCLVEGLESFLETWPRSGMMRSGIAFRLPTLAGTTYATESGLLPTPTATQRGHCASEMRRRSPGLVSAARFWPTPSASDNRDRRNLSSPAVRRRSLIGKQLMLSQVVSDQSGALNPTWVEWLMGFPTDHTDLRVLETPSSLKSPNLSDEP